MASRYFVTGATGFIGGAVARQLLAAGHDVTALVRSPAIAGDLASLGVRLHPGDVTDKESMREGMRGADGIFHLAGWYKVGARDTRPAFRINVDGTRSVLELMRDLDIPKGVYTSTIAVFSNTRGMVVDESYRHDGPWLSEYDRTKWLAHYRVAEPMMRAGLPLVIVQPGVTYGPGDTGPVRPFLVQYLRRRLPALPRQTGYCWAHVEDTSRGHLQAMEHGRTGEAYIIGGPPHRLTDVFALAQEITGIAPPRLRPGPALLRVGAAMMSLIGKIVPLPEAYAAETLRSMAGVTYWGSHAKAARELGFDPRPLADGLRETLAHEMKLLGIA